MLELADALYKVHGLSREQDSLHGMEQEGGCGFCGKRETLLPVIRCVDFKFWIPERAGGVDEEGGRGG